MTAKEMREVIEREVSFDSLKKDSEIFEFHERNGLSIGVSYESMEQHGEKMDVYIYNLFCGGEYINISGYGTKENLIPEEVLHEMVNEWNRLSLGEKGKEVHTGEEKELMRLISMGLDEGLISLSVREGLMTAQIGEHWFYLGFNKVEEGFQFDNIPKEDLVKEITFILSSNQDNELFLYYKAHLGEGIVFNLKKELEGQMETERDAYDQPIGFVSFGEETIEMVYDEDLKVYSITMHDKEGNPVLPYINGDTMEEALKGVFERDETDGKGNVCLDDKIKEAKSDLGKQGQNTKSVSRER